MYITSVETVSTEFLIKVWFFAAVADGLAMHAVQTCWWENA